jgi:poly(3-hydroxybutyrate) depolymerase
MRLLFYEQGNLYGLMEIFRWNMAIFNLIRKYSFAGHKNSNISNNKSTDFFNNTPLKGSDIAKHINAHYEIFDNITKHHPKPEFGIKDINIGDKNYKIFERVLADKPFCQLLHFKKSEKLNQPKLLICAPLSGHYATLLRGTVEDCLQHFDVYITDWKNARDIPLRKGGFDLDDYINYVIDFVVKVGENTNVLAVCQPAVPVMAAMALMSTDRSAFLPKSVSLIGGPIDTRSMPTKVNNFAKHRAMNWFEKNMITRVPINYKGFMRPVYPGFLQLAGFMSMNMQRHVGQHMQLFENLIKGDGENIAKHRKFYDEYFAVMDIPAEFYLQTIETVFKDQSLPNGKMFFKSRRIDLSSIVDLPILAIEGQDDDITGVGQTKAILNLCHKLHYSKKKYHLQEGAGHYGSFNGSKFRNDILPVMKDFIYKFSCNHV